MGRDADEAAEDAAVKASVQPSPGACRLKELLARQLRKEQRGIYPFG